MKKAHKITTKNVYEKIPRTDLIALANFLYTRFEKNKLQKIQHKHNNSNHEAKS